MTTKEQYYKIILNRYNGLIRRQCFVWTRGNTERGKDAYQDILLKLWEYVNALDTCDLDENMWYKVFNITRNVLRTKYGKSIKDYPYGDSRDMDVMVATDLPDYSVEYIKEIKQHLEESDRELLEYILKGYSNGEIAKKMGINANLVNQRKHRMLKRMREIYNQLYKI